MTKTVVLYNLISMIKVFLRFLMLAKAKAC